MKIKFSLLLVILTSILTTFSFAQQTQVPNGDFENWTDSINAQDWNTNNYNIGGFLYYNFVNRSTDFHSGSYAAKIETKNIPLFGNKSGIITLGDCGIFTSISGGYPINGKPIILRGFYKYFPVADDTMSVAIIMTKWTGISRDTLFYDRIAKNTAISEYTLFEIPITYTPDIEAPDTVNIIALSSAGSSPRVGSILYIDDISFVYNNQGINETPGNSIISVFPNPSGGIVSVNLNGEKNNIKIYNIIGETIYYQRTYFKNINIDLSAYPDGVYMLEADNGTNKEIQKLVISK